VRTDIYGSARLANAQAHGLGFREVDDEGWGSLSDED